MYGMMNLLRNWNSNLSKYREIRQRVRYFLIGEEVSSDSRQRTARKTLKLVEEVRHRREPRQRRQPNCPTRHPVSSVLVLPYGSTQRISGQRTDNGE